MKFHIFAFLLIVLSISGGLTTVRAQVDSAVAQVTNSVQDAFAGGITGDGRFIVFESSGNVATENPQNSDSNREIFVFDYAQRRIYQITNTKSLLIDTALPPTFNNIKVDIINTRPVISNLPDAEGRYWIAFGSNATTSTPASPNATNPGSFDANAFTTTGGANPLTSDANTEIWLYRLPLVAPADLTTGAEIVPTALDGGDFVRVTNTLPSRLPSPGTTSTPPFIADDNRDVAVNDDGSYFTFASSRDVVAGGNQGNDSNDEIYVYVRAFASLRQVTQTPAGSIGNPIYNGFPSISGNGLRIAFMSNANNPIVGMTGGSNADNNEEIFFADLDASGAPTGTKRQVTATTRTNQGDVVNTFSFGKRISRNGRYIAFDSYADLASEHAGTNQPGFATFLYDSTLTSGNFRRICSRSDADTAASGGDIQRYPTFTDYDLAGNPATLVMETRMNIKADGTIPANAADGLNNIPARPAQVYSYPLGVPAANATFTRLTTFPAPSFFLATTQPLPSNSVRRMAFNFGQTEVGTGNEDLGSEVFYFLLPNSVRQGASNINFATGASRQPVSALPVPSPTATPTPSPTATPTPTPTPSPSPTPTGSPTPTPSPTPQNPPAVQGVSPGMLAVMNYDAGISQPVGAASAPGSVSRRFTLPVELSGVTMTINGVAVGLRRVSRRQIEFVVPPGLLAATGGSTYPVVLNNNGTVVKGSVVLVPARPDIFTNLEFPGPGGRARALNVTNRVWTSEPFPIRTFRLRGSKLVPTKLRLYLTGVNDVSPSRIFGNAVTIRIGDVNIAGSAVVTNPVLVEPGVFAIDFDLPPIAAGLGNKPIVVSVFFDGVIYTSRLDDTAPFIRIL